MTKRAPKVEVEDESIVFDPFTAPTPVKTVVLAAAYTDADGAEHPADKTVELDRTEADRLLHAGLARTEQQDADAKADLAAAEAQTAEPSGSGEENPNTNTEVN